MIAKQPTKSVKQKGKFFTIGGRNAEVENRLTVQEVNAYNLSKHNESDRSSLQNCFRFSKIYTLYQMDCTINIDKHK
jgi:hypothetical protein